MTVMVVSRHRYAAIITHADFADPKLRSDQSMSSAPTNGAAPPAKTADTSLPTLTPIYRWRDPNSSGNSAPCAPNMPDTIPKASAQATTDAVALPRLRVHQI